MATRKAKASPKRAKKTPPKKISPVPRFSSVAVVVSDRRRAVAWYTERLGLTVVDDDDHWQTVGTPGGSAVLHLCQVSEYDDKAPMEPGNSGIALRLAGDFEAACAALAARGVEFVTPATKTEWGWWAGVKDPDGNELTLVPE